jgi:hypothetical protein
MDRTIEPSTTRRPGSAGSPTKKKNSAPRKLTTTGRTAAKKAPPKRPETKRTAALTRGAEVRVFCACCHEPIRGATHQPKRGYVVLHKRCHQRVVKLAQQYAERGLLDDLFDAVAFIADAAVTFALKHPELLVRLLLKAA